MISGYIYYMVTSQLEISELAPNRNIGFYVQQTIGIGNTNPKSICKFHIDDVLWEKISVEAIKEGFDDVEDYLNYMWSGSKNV